MKGTRHTDILIRRWNELVEKSENASINGKHKAADKYQDAADEIRDELLEQHGIEVENDRDFDLFAKD